MNILEKNPTNGGKKTVKEEAVVMTETASNNRPEWIRLPQPSRRCPHTGLSRSTLNELTIPGPANDNRPPVKSVVLKKRGAMRGIRLISYDSLMAYLESLSDKNNVPSSKKKKGDINE